MPKTTLDRFITSASVIQDRYKITSSLPSVNELLDGGIQSGRSADIVGTFSTGKSTLALDFIANAQRQGLVCAYADVERAFDPSYAEKLGVNLAALQLVKADTAENTLAAIEYLIRNGTKVVVLDSVTAMVPSAHYGTDVDDTAIDEEYYEKTKKVAALGSLLGDWTKRMLPILDYYNAILIYINQYRANFSTMSRSDKKPYGPYLYNHNLTYRLELARIENKDNQTTIEAKCTKNRLGVERRVCQYSIIYGEGLNIKGDLLVHAIRNGVVEKSGAWYYYKRGTPEEIKAQGEKQAYERFPL